MATYDPETVRRLLERDLIEWADNTDLRLIWGDLLQLEGDPIGRLVMLDHVAEQPGPAAERARAEAELLRESLRDRLWSQDIPDTPGVQLHWQRGFVRELEIHVPKLRGPDGVRRMDWFPELMHAAFEQYAMRWLEVVRIHVADGEGQAWLRWTDRVHSMTLREIHVGEPAHPCTRPRGAWESSNISSWFYENDAMIARFPRLWRFSVDGELRRLPCCHGRPQTRVHFISKLIERPLTSRGRAALVRALWDPSNLVHNQAFALAQKLGAAAQFLLEDLAWFLVPPLSKKDPRPSHALRTLAAIGDASAVLLPEALSNAAVLTEMHERHEALMVWLAALGPRAKQALPLVDAVLGTSAKQLPKTLREAAKRARKRIDPV